MGNNYVLVNEALSLLERRFSVFPVDKEKHPLLKWKRYQSDFATEDEVMGWFESLPVAGIAIVTGKISGINVVDIDSKIVPETLERILPDSIELPIALTPSGGRHLYFSYKPGLINRARVQVDVDVRTDGGYLVAPPSSGPNGTPYRWADGLSIHDVTPPSMHKEIIDYLAPGNKVQQSPTKQQQTPTFNITFSKGGRDETIFHLANSLVKSGMLNAEIEQYLEFISMYCDPPFKEWRAKLRSAIQRNLGKAPPVPVDERSLTQEIRDILVGVKGTIESRAVCNSIGVTSKEDKKKVSAILGRMVKECLIEKTEKFGVYKAVDKDCLSIDWKNAKRETVDIILPLGLHELVEIMPGNIILIAGAQNSGKTALMLNIVRDNMHKFEVHYFNSEMGDSELNKRLTKFDDIFIDDWKFHPWERSSNFHDVIKPGRGKINIVDFLEISEDFFKVGGMLTDIHNKLDGATAVVAIQKNPGADAGLGGQRTLEKPRLAVAVDSGLIKIVKGKNWKTERNPNGLMRRFKLVQGCKFFPQGDWFQQTDKGSR